MQALIPGPLALVILPAGVLDVPPLLPLSPGILAVLLAMKRRPVMRYQAKSTLCERLANNLKGILTVTHTNTHRVIIFCDLTPPLPPCRSAASPGMHGARLWGAVGRTCIQCVSCCTVMGPEGREYI